jgi:hypothetical protein
VISEAIMVEEFERITAVRAHYISPTRKIGCYPEVQQAAMRQAADLAAKVREPKDAIRRGFEVLLHRRIASDQARPRRFGLQVAERVVHWRRS